MYEVKASSSSSSVPVSNRLALMFESAPDPLNLAICQVKQYYVCYLCIQIYIVYTLYSTVIF